GDLVVQSVVCPKCITDNADCFQSNCGGTFSPNCCCKWGNGVFDCRPRSLPGFCVGEEGSHHSPSVRELGAGARRLPWREVSMRSAVVSLFVLLLCASPCLAEPPAAGVKRLEFHSEVQNIRGIDGSLARNPAPGVTLSCAEVSGPVAYGRIPHRLHGEKA